ncbi:glycosyltransferase family 4 protein [Sphingopyxis chilensis]
MHIILTINSSWNVVNFRKPLVAALLEDGHRVTIVAPREPEAAQLEAMGCRVVHLKMDRKGLSPLRDLKMLARLAGIFRIERPDVILGFTIKNNIYGALAARMLRIPFIPNVTGLGTIFIRRTLATRVAVQLYRRAFAPLSRVFFQNCDDRDLFVDEAIVTPAQTSVLPGSGIDLDHFRHAPLPAGDRVVFLLIARMLRDKGVVEFVDAARQLRQSGASACFQLLGVLDADNRSAIGRTTMDQWVHEGAVEYLGSATDVRVAIGNADCLVLPSYREGTPRTLLEGAAMGRPVVATDVPGCRQVVEHEVTGYLCRAQDAKDLAHAMDRIIVAGPEQRSAMGIAGRRKMEREYDQTLVIAAYRAAIASVMARG